MFSHNSKMQSSAEFSTETWPTCHGVWWGWWLQTEQHFLHSSAGPSWTLGAPALYWGWSPNTRWGGFAALCPLQRPINFLMLNFPRDILTNFNAFKVYLFKWQCLPYRHKTTLHCTRWRVALQQPQQFDRQPRSSNKVVCVVLQVNGCWGHNLGKKQPFQRSGLSSDGKCQWKMRQTPTLLSLATASETDVLKSSGLFWARVAMRLVAAVTTPYKTGTHSYL